jgi:hypothetical protein
MLTQGNTIVPLGFTFAASKEQMNMIDPKQGPFHPKRTAARVDRSSHLSPNPSAKRAPEAEGVGKQPFVLNRQISFVGS